MNSTKARKEYDYSNTIFCIAGAGTIAVDCLNYLHETKKVSNDRIKILCRKAETGVDGWQKSLRAYAKRNEIEESTIESVSAIQNLVFLSIEYDRIIKPRDFASELLYNIHFSALPEYKGMYTSILPILHNKKETGVTFHLIDSGIDTGDVVFQEKFSINDTDSAADVYWNLVKYGTGLVKRAIDCMLDQSLVLCGEPQSYVNSSYYGKKTLDYNNLSIDLKQTAESIRNQIRAFYFPVYQVPVVHGYKVCGSRIQTERSKASPGTILEDAFEFLKIATIDYDLTILKLHE